MSFFDNARQSRFVRHQEKQENMSRLAGFFLDRLSVQESATLEQRTVTLIARSPASPVARSMLSVAREAKALSVRFQVAFCHLEPTDLVADWSELRDDVVGTAPLAELRWARLAGLTDAHEQMVLGLALSWHGDSMRRDPETRDAFETFETFNTEAARRASAAFKGLWCRATPLSPSHLPVRSKVAELLPHDVLAQPAPGGLEGSNGATVNTRH